jgi:hypothetical protein
LLGSAEERGREKGTGVDKDRAKKRRRRWGKRKCQREEKQRRRGIGILPRTYVQI